MGALSLLLSLGDGYKGGIKNFDLKLVAQKI